MGLQFELQLLPIIRSGSNLRHCLRYHHLRAHLSSLCLQKETSLLGYHHGIRMGVRQFCSSCSRHQESAIHPYRFRLPDPRASRSYVGECFRLHGHGKDDLLLRSRPEGLWNQRHQNRQNICVARYSIVLSPSNRSGTKCTSMS